MKKGYLKTSDGAHIYYEDWGEGEDTILLVPGHMCTTKFFVKNAEVLAKNHRVVLMDNRGFGNSSKPLHGNSIERNADDIRELIGTLNLQSVILAGWSLSGSIVVTYAYKYKSYRLKALGLIDCCLFPFASENWNSYQAKNYNMDIWNQKYRLWYADPETYFENFMSRLREWLNTQEETLFLQEIQKTPPWIGFALHSDWCHRDCASLLSELHIPVIIFSGKSAGHSFTMGSFYQTQISSYSEHHEFEEGGHLLFYIKYQEFNKLLTSFIKKIS